MSLQIHAATLPPPEIGPAPRRVALAELLAAPGRRDGFSMRFLRDMLIYPFTDRDGATVLAMADPADAAAVRAAELVLGTDVVVAEASPADIAAALDRGDDSAEQPAPVATIASDDDIDGLRDLASGAPVVRALNDLFDRAAEWRASDIHIEPQRGALVVRLRVDGVLRVAAPPAVPPQALLSRVKILAGLNIAERRLPQDGAARVRAGRGDCDIRVATMPTQHGESAVIRLLPRDRGLLDPGRLGLASHDRAQMLRLLDLPHGMIVVTGPTGSGKTTTLATLLSLLNTQERKILTVEDPVEYDIPGIAQSQVKPAIGLTFASALRAFVRQDPDVIMVGEIRDAETAHIATHAALTGHLVLTTLHTESAAAAIPRLLDLGVAPYLLRSVLRAVVAQRLVRVLCAHCRVEQRMTPAMLTDDPRLGEAGFRAGETLYAAHGCAHCGDTGFHGRAGVFEVLDIAAGVRALIGTQDGHAIDRAAIAAGMTTMTDDALAKVRAGVTTAAEMFRVTTLR